jgi:hypothetical protein
MLGEATGLSAILWRYRRKWWHWCGEPWLHMRLFSTFRKVRCAVEEVITVTTCKSLLLNPKPLTAIHSLQYSSMSSAVALVSWRLSVGIHISACFIVSDFCHSHFVHFFFRKKQLFANEIVESEFEEGGNYVRPYAIACQDQQPWEMRSWTPGCKTALKRDDHVATQTAQHFLYWFPMVVVDIQSVPIT